MTWSLIDIGEGYHRGALNLTSYHSQSFHPVFSTYRPLISSPSLKLGAYQHYNQSLYPIKSTVLKSHEWNQPLDFYRGPVY
jgi:hypothetical protein